jgi:hypothetical protein
MNPDQRFTGAGRSGFGEINRTEMLGLFELNGFHRVRLAKNI